MKESEPRKIKKPQESISKVAAILDGKGAQTLLESAKYFELESGDIVIAGTDQGFNYDHNEDRVVAGTKSNFLGVIDGMGGEKHGERAAALLAQNLLENPENIEYAVGHAKVEMQRHNIGKGGAVFIAGRVIIEESEGSKEKSLDISQLGDAKLMIINKASEVTFESKDQSRAQELVDMGIITADEALYNESLRRLVTGVVSISHNDPIKKYPIVGLEEGDMVLLMSDGISDNFTSDEIAREVKNRNLNAKELFAWLSDATSKRMLTSTLITDRERRKKGVYPDGYKTKPKPDNRALIIMEIK
jgi:serine/threonine protein phosphatase PrpC